MVPTLKDMGARGSWTVAKEPGTPAPQGVSSPSRPGLSVGTRTAHPLPSALPGPTQDGRWSPAHLASLARNPDKKTAGGPMWPGACVHWQRLQNLSLKRAPRGVPTGPLHREKQGKLRSAGFQKAPARSHGLSPCGWVGAPGGATEGAEELSGGELPSGAPGQPLAALQGQAAGGETEAPGTQAPTTQTSCPLGREQGPHRRP